MTYSDTPPNERERAELAILGGLNAHPEIGQHINNKENFVRVAIEQAAALLAQRAESEATNTNETGEAK